MKKIKLKLLEPNYKTINIDGLEFNIDLNKVNSYFGYTPIMAMYKENENYIVYIALLDKDLKPVIPLRKEICTLEDINNNTLKYDIMIFDNNKVIYINDDYSYLINLKETNFIKENNLYVPDKYIIKFNALYSLGTDLIIVYNEDSSYLYDVSKEKRESKVYDYIKPTKKPDVFLAYYLVKNKHFFPLFAEFEIEKNFKVNNRISLNDNIILYTDDETMNNKKKIIKYCDDAYNSYVENKGNVKCKQIKQ